MAAIACLIKKESEGPAIFSQHRLGKNGEVFSLYKFRTMYTSAELKGAQWATEGDPRVTPLGKILRSTRLDELPQFWNVVKGDMSLIGPETGTPHLFGRVCTTHRRMGPAPVNSSGRFGPCSSYGWLRASS